MKLLGGDVVEKCLGFISATQDLAGASSRQPVELGWTSSSTFALSPWWNSRRNRAERRGCAALSVVSNTRWVFGGDPEHCDHQIAATAGRPPPLQLLVLRRSERCGATKRRVRAPPSVSMGFGSLDRNREHASVQGLRPTANGYPKGGARDQERKENISDADRPTTEQSSSRLRGTCCCCTEKTVEEMLPKLASEATTSDLCSDGRGAPRRSGGPGDEDLERILGGLLGRRGATCHERKAYRASEGLEAKHDGTMQEEGLHRRDEVLDIFLNGAAARTEHYEIAAYTGLRSMARKLGVEEIVGAPGQICARGRGAREVESISKKILTEATKAKQRPGRRRRTTPRANIVSR